MASSLDAAGPAYTHPHASSAPACWCPLCRDNTHRNIEALHCGIFFFSFALSLLDAQMNPAFYVSDVFYDFASTELSCINDA